ncbi:MAG: uroporphyrinogen-III synthase [Nostocales cyanobacterium]|nr:MAG: uroporphyrinogen-III synthase [Nostocales cyanobacterium]TAF16151.1 MAG: uroporphyrinogen-III synthase [Nostocales cyanobacterium]
MLRKMPENNILTPSKELPLYGKRILVTSPRSYALRLSEEIIKMGGIPVFMPTIETCCLSNDANLANIFNHLDKYNWITFTSRNGIMAFFQRLKTLKIPVSALQDNKLCALGKDAELLLSLSGRVDLIPHEPSPAGIVAELSKIPNINQQKVLVPVPQVVGLEEPNVIPNFINDLNNLGMEVTRLPAYITKRIDKIIYQEELNLIKQGKIDIIAFTSTGEIESFLQMFDSHQDYKNSVIACFGPYTAANARSFGLNVRIVAKDFSSFAGFTKEMAEFYQDSLVKH